MSIIKVRNLSKSYRVYKKREGLAESVRGLFRREYSEVEAVKVWWWALLLHLFRAPPGEIASSPCYAHNHSPLPPVSATTKKFDVCVCGGGSYCTPRARTRPRSCFLIATRMMGPYAQEGGLPCALPLPHTLSPSHSLPHPPTRCCSPHTTATPCTLSPTNVCTVRERSHHYAEAQLCHTRCGL